MRRMSLTDFVDVISKSGTPKATHVTRIINRPKYTPASDFYKPLRDCIIETHRGDLSPKTIQAILNHLKDEKKAGNYPDAVKGYCSWWGSKTLQWFEPPTGEFERHGVAVSVNPELGLLINGCPHIIKLYFKAEKLAKNRIEIVTHLMDECLRPMCRNKEMMAVLDVRNAKLFTAKSSMPTLSAMLGAELAYVSALWEE